MGFTDPPTAEMCRNLCNRCLFFRPVFFVFIVAAELILQIEGYELAEDIVQNDYAHGQQYLRWKPFYTKKRLVTPQADQKPQSQNLDSAVSICRDKVTASPQTSRFSTSVSNTISCSLQTQPIPHDPRDHICNNNIF
jgi:hypothetical protein